MDRHQSGVLISIRQVLVDILHHKLVSMRFHPRVHETRKIEIGAAIKVELVFDELVRGRRVGAIVWQSEFRDFSGGSVARAVGVVVGAVFVVAVALLVWVFAERGKKLIGVDMF
jgi:hypothetical protein